jgi:hypothetical protein
VRPKRGNPALSHSDRQTDGPFDTIQIIGRQSAQSAFESHARQRSNPLNVCNRSLVEKAKVPKTDLKRAATTLSCDRHVDDQGPLNIQFVRQKRNHGPHLPG